MIHIMPFNDIQPHEETGTQCPCNPKVLFNDPETGEAFAEALVIHRAWDGRELIEEADSIVNKESEA